MKKPNEYAVQTTNKSFDIIEYLMDTDRAGVTEIARNLEMPKSIVHNHLSTLIEREYAIKEDGQYRLSLKFLEIGSHVRERVSVSQNARIEIRKLAEETGEVVNLATEELGMCVYLYQAQGQEAVRLDINSVGGREHLHCSAIGKSILAHLPADQVNTIIKEHGLPPQTANTIVDRSELKEELDIVRERGFAKDAEEAIPGLRCVAAPIINQDDNPLGAVSVSGPASRFKGDRWDYELPDQVLRTSNILELNSQYAPSRPV